MYVPNITFMQRFDLNVIQEEDHDLVWNIPPGLSQAQWFLMFLYWYLNISPSYISFI